MARKVFISILGTNHYLKTRYYFGDKQSNNEQVTRFVQEATMLNLCSKWTNNDIAYIFVTDDAKNSNWNNPAQIGNNKGEYTGLSQIINDLNFNFTTEAISIPEGYSEEEVWRIFEIVFNKLEEKDELYFDVTHSFRSIPMLVMVLINYAKFLQNIKVKKIYYGAFEKLGPAYKVNEIPVEERFAPILDITSFSELQDWTSAANEFLNFGNTTQLASIFNTSIETFSKKEKNKIKGFSQALNDVGALFTTLRGKEIIDGKRINELKNILETLRERNKLKALNPIIKQIDKKISVFNLNSLKNGFVAIDWCIDHDLIQQAITLSQEMIITFLCNYWQDKYELDYKNKLHREALSSLFGVVSAGISESNWTGSLKVIKTKAIKIKEEQHFVELVKTYSKLTQIRNSINHAGFIGVTNAKEITVNFKKYYQEIRQKININ